MLPLSIASAAGCRPHRAPSLNLPLLMMPLLLLPDTAIGLLTREFHCNFTPRSMLVLFGEQNCTRVLFNFKKKNLCFTR
jgi:hypothetical protein